jgi:hypothetical protein
MTKKVHGVQGLKFTVEVVDNGERGKGKDTFAMDVPSVLTIAPTTSEGGNIRVHK